MATIRGSFRALHREIIRWLRQPPVPEPLARAMSAEEQARLDLAEQLGIDPRRLPHDSDYDEDDGDGDGEENARNDVPVVDTRDDAIDPSLMPDTADTDIEGDANDVPSDEEETASDAADDIVTDDLDTAVHAIAPAEIENEPPVEDQQDISRDTHLPPSWPGEAILSPQSVEPTLAIEEGGRSISNEGVLDAASGVSRTAERHDRVPGGPALERDRAALLHIVRYRIVSYRQLMEHLFSGRHFSVVGRRMQALENAGFVQRWEQRQAIGGHPRFVLPTKKGLRWALNELRAEAKGTPHEKLVDHLLRAPAKKPLVLAPNIEPPFLTHQEETNRLVATLERIPALGIVFASTWHRPFGNRDLERRTPLPQPDAVIVATRDGTPHLVLLEHDRNQEAAEASWKEAKTRRYVDLAKSGAVERLFGFTSFTVLVTVIDEGGKPLRRIQALQKASTDARMMRFTLAEWVHGHAATTAEIWFTPTTPITASGHHPTDHANLVGPFSRADESMSFDMMMYRDFLKTHPGFDAKRERDLGLRS
jgi:hypothetical protein